MNAWTLIPSSLVLTVALCAAPAAAQVEVDAELTESLHGTDDELLVTHLLAPSPVDTFIVDFGGFNTPTTFDITWRAPANTRFQIDIPGDAQSATFFASIDIGGSSTSDELLLPMTPSFDDFVGQPLTPNAFSRLEVANVSNLQIAGGMNFTLTPGQSYSFSSITGTVTIPDTYNIAHNTTVDDMRLTVLAPFDPPPLPTDPPLIRLVAIPEPASAALLAVGSLALLRRRIPNRISLH